MGDDRFETSDGFEIAYRVWGGDNTGSDVVLQHGYIANGVTNWELPGVVTALVDDGHRVIAPDALGHGRSSTPHDPAVYGEARMARDLVELFDHLALDAVRLAGYSMGAIVALLATSMDRRVRRLVVGGIGRGVVDLGGVDRDVLHPDRLVEALEVDDPASLPEGQARSFRLFADGTGGDRLALAAQARAVHREPLPLARITVPTLVIAGVDDPLARAPDVLRDAIPGAELTMVPGDHLSAVGPPLTAALVDFFRS